jgi:hypothetical protein
MGCNSPGVSHPVTLIFQWGEGPPKVGGVEMLPHEAGKWASKYCCWCHKEFGGKPSDCPERRLRAFAQEPQDARHLKAVKLWHSKDPRVDD